MKLSSFRRLFQSERRLENMNRTGDDSFSFPMTDKHMHALQSRVAGVGFLDKIEEVSDVNECQIVCSKQVK